MFLIYLVEFFHGFVGLEMGLMLGGWVYVTWYDRFGELDDRNDLDV